jgi:hypothetical protein
MADRPLIILDFDRTLFSERFYERFVALMSQKKLLPKDVADKLLITIADPTQTIDLLAPLKLAGVDPANALNIATRELSSESFLYPDVADFLARHKDFKIVILTTGVDIAWQQAKLALCPELKPYQQIVILGNKGHYLLSDMQTSSDKVSLKELAGEWFDRLVLVDDRIEALVPLIGTPKVELWQVERPGAKYQRTHDHEGVHHVASLKEIQIA